MRRILRKLTGRKSQPRDQVQAAPVEVDITPQSEKRAVSIEAARLAARLERLKLEAGILH